MKSLWPTPGFRRSLMVLVVMLVAACGTGGLGGGEEGMPAPARQVYVDVENHNWADVVVYAVRYGARTRLGTVTSMGRERFDISAALIGAGSDLYLVADPIGGAAPYVFPPVMVQNGQRVEMRLENNLRLSSVSVW